MAANTKAVTDATFATDVLQSDKPVLVDFWAEWCGPCKMVAPVLEEIAGEHAEKLNVVKINIDENPNAARDYQIMSIPTMAVFQGGQLVVCARYENSAGSDRKCCVKIYRSSGPRRKAGRKSRPLHNQKIFKLWGGGGA